MRAKPPPKPITRWRSSRAGWVVVTSAKPRRGRHAAREGDIEYATMALISPPRSRAVSVLMSAVFGAGAVVSVAHGQSPAPPAAATAKLAADPDDGGITLPEGFRAVVVADALK